MQFSIVDFSEINSGNRIDAEYYRPVFLEVEQKLKHGEWDYLENLTESIKSFGAYSLCNQIEYQERGIPFIRCRDIRGGIIDFSNVLYIDSDANHLLCKSEIKPETVLLTMSGTVGNSAIATEKLKYPINSNQDIAKIITNKRLNPCYFSVFLQSAYGNRQVNRLPIGSVQQHIFLWQIEKLAIPLFSDKFQTGIERMFKNFLYLHEKSVESFSKAQALLLSELGLADWQPKHQLAFIKNYSDVETAGRIDAEYFQPKYEEIIRVIQSYSGGWDTLENIVVVRDKKFNPDETQQYRYIELANIAGNGEITDCMFGKGRDLPTRARCKVVTGDVIVSSIEGSLPSIALIEKEYDHALCSTGFHVINSDALNPETLLVLLKSVVGQLQLKKRCSGTILTAISKDEFGKVILPKVFESKQTQIQQKVQESFALRKQSKHLLECAKRAVEMAIEKDEKTAIKWLESAAHGNE